MPDRVYQKRKDDIVSATLEHVKMHLPKGYPLNEKKEKEWLLSFFNEIREMSSVEFTLNKEKLAQKLKSRYNVVNVEIAVWAKIEKFLLSPAIISLLEEIKE